MTQPSSGSVTHAVTDVSGLELEADEPSGVELVRWALGYEPCRRGTVRAERRRAEQTAADHGV